MLDNVAVTAEGPRDDGSPYADGGPGPGATPVLGRGLFTRAIAMVPMDEPLSALDTQMRRQTPMKSNSFKSFLEQQSKRVSDVSHDFCSHRTRKS